MLRRLFTTPGPDGGRPPRTAGISFVLALVPLLILLVAGWDRRWMSDDGFIHLRVVDQILNGNGPVFNAGERVEVSTSPLWVWLLAALKFTLAFARLEWITVIGGLALAVAGLALAERGAWLLVRSLRPERRLIVPLGALVVIATPPFWDFATSGLEGGLEFAWLGACFWALVRARARVDGPRWRRTAWGTAALLGLGPLVRPDFGLFSIAFVAVLLLIDRQAAARRRWSILAATLLAPAAYQVFRMWYYAALVPNTALAKEASTTEWSVGVGYLRDFVDPYWLGVPGAILLIAVVALVWSALWARDSVAVALVAAPVIAGLAHGAYFVSIGGDFMHARQLLPALFALTLPVAVTSVGSIRSAGLAGAMAAWALVCGIGLRIPYDVAGPNNLSDERAAWILRSGEPRPVVIEDFRLTWARFGMNARGTAERGERAFELVPYGPVRYLRLPLADSVTAGGVVAYPAIGQLAYAAGPDVHVVDLLGLGDAVGSRNRLQRFFLPGHNKYADPAWAVAEFVAPTTPIDVPAFAARVADARAALACGRLGALRRDIRDPLTVRQGLTNLVDALPNTVFRFAPDPTAARAELCRPGAG